MKQISSYKARTIAVLASLALSLPATAQPFDLGAAWSLDTLWSRLERWLDLGTGSKSGSCADPDGRACAPAPPAGANKSGSYADPNGKPTAPTPPAGPGG